MPDNSPLPSGTNESGRGDRLEDVPFVTFTWSRDVHYAKALLGSIRYFYPDRRIIVVAERDLPRHDIRQIARFPNTEVLPVMDLIRRHKLHLVGLLNKLNVLFLPDVRRAIVADADSVLVDSVVEKIDARTVFTALNGETLANGDEEGRRAFETWAFRIEDARRIDPAIRTSGMRFVQGSHFYIDTDRFPYDLLMRSLPHLGFRHEDRTTLKAGDQGFWNILANSSLLDEADCAVVPSTAPAAKHCIEATRPEWNTLPWITRRGTKAVSFIHYVGGGRRYRRRAHVCPEPLAWGTALYYDRIGRHVYVADEIRRAVAMVLRRFGRLMRARNQGLRP